MWYNRKVAPISLFLVVLLLVFIGLNLITFGSSSENRFIQYSVILRNYGVAPEEIERTITIPLEDAVSILGGIKEISSLTEINKSRINIKLDPSTDYKNFFLYLRDTVESFYRQLPDTVQRPEIFSSNLNNRPLLVVAFDIENHTLTELRDLVEVQIKPEIEQIPGVGEVEISGGEPGEIHVVADVEKLSSININFADIASMLKHAYGNVTTGMVRENHIKIPLIVKGRIASIEELSKMVLPTPSGGQFILSEVAEIYWSKKETETISRVNGKRKILLSLKGSGTHSQIEVSKEAIKVLDSFPNISSSIIYNFGNDLAKTIREVILSLGISMASLFLFLLLTYRDALYITILVLSLPFTALTTLAVLSYAGFSLDLGILAGIGIGIGLMADTGIILVSAIDIYAKKNSIKKIFPALLASTVTTLAAVAPLFFIPGVSRTLRQISVSFAALMCISLILNIIFLPAFLYRPQRKTRFFKKFSPYRLLIRLFWFIEVKVLNSFHPTLIGGIILILVFTVSILFLPRSTYNPQDENYIFAQLEFESGTSVDSVDKSISWVAEQLVLNPSVIRIETNSRRNNGTLTLEYNPLTISKEEMIDTMDMYNNLLPNAFLYIQDQGNSDTRIEITLIGPDDIYLKRKAKEVAEKLLSKPFINRTVLHFKKGDPELVYKPKRNQMIKSGVNLKEVISFLRWGIHGPVSLKWFANGKEIDLRIMGDEAVFNNLEKIENASITIEGRPTLLQTIGTFTIKEGRGRIYRLNRQRSVSLSIHTPISNLNKISNLLEMAVSQIPMKEGHLIRIDPALKELQEQYKFLIAILLLTILIIYMVLASQYESFITPFLIIITIPLSLSFPLGVLFLLGKAISINTIIALIVVTGLVVNNSILIVDGVQNYQKCQLASQKILWGLRKRLKPMLLTTGSTILGLIPLILPSISPSPLIRHLSLVVITGITGSTVVSLFIIPSVLNKFPIFVKLKNNC